MSATRPVVFIQHGLMGTDEKYVLSWSKPTESLGEFQFLNLEFRQCNVDIIISLTINRPFGYHSIHNSTGYLLSDAGYDIWLGNFRGNYYSMAHQELDPEEFEFWDFG